MCANGRDLRAGASPHRCRGACKAAELQMKRLARCGSCRSASIQRREQGGVRRRFIIIINIGPQNFSRFHAWHLHPLHCKAGQLQSSVSDARLRCECCIDRGCFASNQNARMQRAPLLQDRAVNVAFGALAFASSRIANAAKHGQRNAKPHSTIYSYHGPKLVLH